jgi:hypothetical protein
VLLKGQVLDEFAFVLLAGLILIIVMMVAFNTPQGGNQTNTTNISEGNFSANDVPKFINLGDFTVSYSLGSDVIAQKKDVEVTNGWGGTSRVNLVGIVANDKLLITNSGFIEIIIDDTNSAGNLIVEFNGQEVFNKKVDPGRASIQLTKDQIKDSNVVSIKAGGSGWKFWETTVYKIASAKLGINYQGTSFKTFQFPLTSDEVSNFRFGRLSFRISSSTSPSDMLIAINDQKFFRGVPPSAFIRDFGSEMPLIPGVNNITFSVEKASSYDLADVTLTIVRSR